MSFPNKNTQFKPGNKAAVGHGRPRGMSISKRIERIIEHLDVPEDVIEGLPKDGKFDSLDASIAQALALAMQGSDKHLAIILDRLYGKPQQSIDHTTAGEKVNVPPQIVVTDSKTAENIKKINEM